MNLKYKTILQNSTPRNILFLGVRVGCVAGIAYYSAQTILSGVSTLGAIMYSLFPVFALGGILLLLETQKGNFASLFSLPAHSDLKASKKYLPLLVVTLILGMLLVFYMNSPVDLVMVLLVIFSAGLAGILMLRGQGVEALCVFVLAWPFIIFESGHGRFFFYLTNRFNEISPFNTPDFAMLLYICLILTCWLIGLLMNPRRLVPSSWSSGIWLFVVAGLLSTLFSPQPISSMNQFIRVILLPVLLFVFFVNEVRSWNDVKKLSGTLGFTMAIITLVWLYYALYRDPEPSLALSEFASSRGGGGKTLGSAYPGYNGIYYEYLSPLILPSVLALLVTAKSMRAKRFWTVTSILMLAATFLTFGRNGWVATLLCLQPWIWRYRRGRVLGVLALVGCLVLPNYFKELSSALSSRLANFASWEIVQESIHFRIWMAAVDIFLKHPWHGIGVGMFHQFSPDYNLFVWVKDEFSSKSIRLNIIEAHGTFFQIISELGILGLSAWCAMLWMPLRSFWCRTKKNISWSSEEFPWIHAFQAYSLVLIFFFFVGPLSWWGVESPRVILFLLWLAVISNKNGLWRELHPSKDIFKDQCVRIGSTPSIRKGYYK